MEKLKKIISFCSDLLLLASFLVFTSLYFFIKDVSQKTHKNFWYWPKTIFSVVKNPTPVKPFNLLILGLDERHDQLEDTQVTDTIILSKLNPQTGRIDLLSIPRDLWFYPLSAKVNAIYPQSLQTDNHLDFIKTNFAILTGQTIDHILIFSTQDLANLIDLVGGVDVHLDTGFTDNQFPNPEYINNPTPNIPTYITISFPAGINHIDSGNVAYFVRSRKGADTVQDGGTDLGRIQRQQLLIQSLLDKLKNKNQLTYDQIINLYNFWSHLDTGFTDQYLLNLAFYVFQNQNYFSLVSHDLTPFIYHPNYLVQKQWVFLPIKQDYSHIHQFIEEQY